MLSARLGLAVPSRGGTQVILLVLLLLGTCMARLLFPAAPLGTASAMETAPAAILASSWSSSQTDMDLRIIRLFLVMLSKM